MWKTGHSLIKSKIKEEKALLAGEMSGHMFFADRYYGFDDAIYAACRLLEIVSKNSIDQTTHALFLSIPDSVNTPELQIPVSESTKFSMIERLLFYGWRGGCEREHSCFIG